MKTMYYQALVVNKYPISLRYTSIRSDSIAGTQLILSS